MEALPGNCLSLSPVNLFDRDSEDVQALLAEMEGLTSDRLHRWREFVSEEDFRSGDGWGAVMASFCYVRAARFNDMTFGAYCCSDSIHTAIAEWSYHTGSAWLDFGLTDEVSAVVRSYVGSFKKELVDLRGADKCHGPDYAYPQAQAKLLKVDGEFGILYSSVRNPGGVCAALLRPPATSAVKQAAHYTIQWNGDVFTAFAKVSEYENL